MDLSTIMIGLVSLALFVVPVWYLQRKQKSETNKLLNDFLSLGASQQLNITRHELWSDCYGIGLDEGRQKLFYVHTCGDKEQQMTVNLADIKKSAVVSISREASGSKIIDLIELRLTPRNPERSELRLEIYNKEKSILLSGELQLAEKWSAMINEAIAAVPAAATRPSVATA